MTLSNIHGEFIKALNQSQTAYLIVGGIAVVAHGVDRNTGDMDIWVEDSEPNLQALQVALHSLDFDETDVEDALEAFREKGKIAIVLDQKFPIEMMSSFSTSIAFETAFSKKVVVNLAGINVNVVDLETLVDMKIRAGREKDLWDVSQLKKKKDSFDK